MDQFSESDAGISGAVKPAPMSAFLPISHPSVSLFQENGFEQRVYICFLFSHDLISGLYRMACSMQKTTRSPRL